MTQACVQDVLGDFKVKLAYGEDILAPLAYLSVLWLSEGLGLDLGLLCWVLGNLLHQAVDLLLLSLHSISKPLFKAAATASAMAGFFWQVGPHAPLFPPISIALGWVLSFPSYKHPQLLI